MTKKENTGKRDVRRNNIVQLLLGIAIVILVNVISYYAFTRIDLTAEKRYTLSDQTKQLLGELDDIGPVERVLNRALLVLGELPADKAPGAGPVDRLLVGSADGSQALLDNGWAEGAFDDVTSCADHGARVEPVGFLAQLNALR